MKTNLLAETFKEISLKYSDDNQLIIELWNEIENNYTDSKRYYHNLLHLESIFNELSIVKGSIWEWDTIVFSMYYHDLVYNPSQNDNEKRSAEIAKNRLQSISFTSNKVFNCINQILSTKEHSKSDENDTNLFIDADLSILGQEMDLYLNYCKQIRMEYFNFPDTVYKKGRKAVLHHFLEMKFIFKTEYFFNKYENQARLNISNELKELNNEII